MQTRVTAVVSCHKPKQSLFLPSVHCGRREITVKLPPEARPQRVRTLGRYAVERGTYTISGPVVMKISNTEETDSVLEIIYLDSDGEMSTILVPCFTAAKRIMGTQFPKALGGQGQPNVTNDTPSTKDPNYLSAAELKSGNNTKNISTSKTDALTTTTFTNENMKYISASSDVSSTISTTTITATLPVIGAQSRSTGTSGATTHLYSHKELVIFLSDDSTITAETDSATPSPAHILQKEYLNSLFDSQATTTSSTITKNPELKKNMLTNRITQAPFLKETSEKEDPYAISTTNKATATIDDLIETKGITQRLPYMTASLYTARALNENIDDSTLNRDSRKLKGMSFTISKSPTPSLPFYTISQNESTNQTGLHAAKASSAKTYLKKFLVTTAKFTPKSNTETGSMKENLTYVRSSKPAKHNSPTSSTYDPNLINASEITTVLSTINKGQKKDQSSGIKPNSAALKDQVKAFNTSPANPISSTLKPTTSSLMTATSHPSTLVEIWTLTSTTSEVTTPTIPGVLTNNWTSNTIQSSLRFEPQSASDIMPTKKRLVSTKESQTTDALITTPLTISKNSVTPTTKVLVQTTRMSLTDGHGLSAILSEGTTATTTPQTSRASVPKTTEQSINSAAKISSVSIQSTENPLKSDATVHLTDTLTTTTAPDTT
ncbi:mucin-5AC-like, partial [Oryzias melastigma]|uniref:mucin-5AC-like n=1 Tax=Oryzias melastigma TaxID=30732 RepID=UPI00168CD0EB